MGVRLSWRRRGALLLGMMGASALSCFGSAFSINELGVRASGMGTAFTAVADDGSALFYNPAGIAFQPGKHLQMDSLVVVGLFRFTPSATPVGQVVPANGYSQSIKPHFIPVASMYATAEINKKFTFGFGMFTPFGLSANSTNFHDDDPNLTKFVGRFAGTRARLEEFWFQPTLAYKITDNMSVAVGPAFVHTHLFIEQSFLNPLDDGLTFGRQAANTIFPGVPKEQAAQVIARLLPEGRSRIAGTANTVGFSAGFLYKSPKYKTNIGINYRSAVTNHLSGKASFAFGKGYTLEPYVGSDFLFKAFPNQDIKGTFTTPATYAIGISNTSIANMRISFDFRMQDYKRFSSVPLNFGINEVNTKGVALPVEQRLRFDFQNSYQYAFGVERTISPTLTIRAGYLRDQSPVPDKSTGPLFPDANRNSYMFGGTAKRGTTEYSFFYEAMNFVNRNTNVAENNKVFTNGLYDNFAHLAGLGLRFDMPQLPSLKKFKR